MHIYSLLGAGMNLKILGRVNLQPNNAMKVVGQVRILPYGTPLCVVCCVDEKKQLWSNRFNQATRFIS